jgi:CspA family cold shock protein
VRHVCSQTTAQFLQNGLTRHYFYQLVKLFPHGQFRQSPKEAATCHKPESVSKNLICGKNQPSLNGYIIYRTAPIGSVIRSHDDANLPHNAGRTKQGVTTMATGTVKWFNTTKGYGFIAPESGGKDIFVHISAVERSGLTGLADNQKVTYDLEAGRDGRESAVNIALA